MKNRFLMFIN